MTLARDEPALSDLDGAGAGGSCSPCSASWRRPRGPRAKAAPDAATLLFDEPQLEATHPGDVLTYDYSRKTVGRCQIWPILQRHDRPDDRGRRQGRTAGPSRR